MPKHAQQQECTLLQSDFSEGISVLVRMCILCSLSCSFWALRELKAVRLLWCFPPFLQRAVLEQLHGVAHQGRGLHLYNTFHGNSKGGPSFSV